MPRRDGELIGHATCPECEFPNAEVRRDRSGNPYRICKCCTPATVYLTRGAPAKVARLLGKLRPLPSKPAMQASRSRIAAAGGTSSSLARQLAELHRCS